VTCTHLHGLADVHPSSPDGCTDCLAIGDTWVNLRICLVCGHVGCCNDSKNKHATQHHHATGHAVMQSFQPGEGWRYCFVDQVMVGDAPPFRPPRGGGDPGATPAGVIRSYYAIAGTYTLAASLIWGVNTLFLLNAGLDIFEVFLANAAYTVGTVLFEVPTGVLADTRGRRVSFLVGVLVLLVTTLAYALAAELGMGLLTFALVSVLVGLGFTFYSGAVEAWLVDALDATGFRGALDPVFARGSMVTGFAMLLGSIGGGALGMIDLAIPYVARAALLAVSFGIAFFWMKDLGFQPRTTHLGSVPQEMRRVARESARIGFGIPPIRWLVGVQLVEWGFLMWAWYAWQPYFLELWGDPNAVWLAGLISAAMSLAMIAGNSLVDVLTRYCGRRTTLMAWGMGAQVLAALVVGLTSSFWVAVVAFLALIASAGVIGPVRSTSLHKLISKEHRASIVSFDSMVSSAGSIAGQTGLGWVSRARSIPDGFVLGGFASLLAFPILYVLRRLDDPSDFVIGERARELGTCAAQGTPAIGQVDG
jgi:MFS family permease